MEARALGSNFLNPFTPEGSSPLVLELEVKETRGLGQMVPLTMDSERSKIVLNFSSAPT